MSHRKAKDKDLTGRRASCRRTLPLKIVRLDGAFQAFDQNAASGDGTSIGGPSTPTYLLEQVVFGARRPRAVFDNTPAPPPSRRDRGRVALAQHPIHHPPRGIEW